MRFRIPWIALLVILLLFPAVVFSAEPNPKIWEPLGYHSYYNIKIITKSPGIFLAWTYTTMTEDVRRRRMEEVRKYDLEKSIKYRNYHHECVLWEVDCQNKRIMMKEFIDFDRNGLVLDRYRYDGSQWEQIIPDSGGERLYRNICLPQKKPLKRKK